jgi:hypothetical protein
MIQTKGNSTLIGQVGKLIGFGFTEHLILENSFIEVILYQTKLEYVICISEGPIAGVSLTNRANAQRPGLGKDVPGKDFAPFAQRSIETKLPYEELKRLINESLPLSLPGIKLEWYK